MSDLIESANSFMHILNRQSKDPTTGLTHASGSTTRYHRNRRTC